MPAASGKATLTKTASGWRIQLSATGLPRLENGRFYEAWLRNSSGVLVPVGTFNDGRHVTLWAGVSPKDFSTLTVTRERADGDQALIGPEGARRARRHGQRLARIAVDSTHDLLTRAIEAAHNGAFADPEGSRRLLVREARDVDGDEDVAEVVG